MSSVRTGKAKVVREKSYLRSFARVLMAGPLVLIVTLLVFLAMPLWFPPGIANLNNFVMPVFLFPILWVSFFIYACLERKLFRALLSLMGLTIINGGLLYLKFTGLAF